MYINRKIDKNHTYTIVNRRISEIGRFTIIQDSLLIDGETYQYSFESMDDAVVVLPVADNGVVLIRQYRHAIDDWVWELPAGGLSANEPSEAARKELLEESGYIADELYDLGYYYISEGTSDTKTYFFAAKCHENVGQRCEPTEYIEVHKVTANEMEQMINRHEIVTSSTVLAWELFKRKEGLIIESK